jgi:hypothetical protein
MMDAVEASHQKRHLDQSTMEERRKVRFMRLSRLNRQNRG